MEPFILIERGVWGRTREKGGRGGGGRKGCMREKEKGEDGGRETKRVVWGRTRDRDGVQQEEK